MHELHALGVLFMWMSTCTADTMSADGTVVYQLDNGTNNDGTYNISTLHINASGTNRKKTFFKKINSSFYPKVPGVKKAKKIFIVVSRHVESL